MTDSIISAHLAELVGCRTVSEEDFHSSAEFEKFDRLLTKFYPSVFSASEKIPLGESTFIRIPGGENAPVVLMSHKDVVSEGKKKWKYPAFAGEIHGGKMYGRGTFDCKGSLCCIFEALEDLLKNGCSFDRDIYILNTATEEIGGSDAPSAVEYFKEKGIKPWLVLDEGGAILTNPFPSKTKRFAMAGAVERSSGALLYSCTKEQADKIKSAVKKLHPGKYEITPEVSELLQGLADTLYPPLGNIISFLCGHKKAAAKLLYLAGGDARAFCGASMRVRDLGESDKKSIKKEFPDSEIPVRIGISGNYYNKIGDLLDETEKALKNTGAKLLKSTSREADAPTLSTDVGYVFIDSLSKKCFDNIKTLPYPVLGRTDSRYFVGYAENVVRYLPLEITLSQMTKFHCPNENINVSSLAPAAEFYKQFLCSFIRSSDG